MNRAGLARGDATGMDRSMQRFGRLIAASLALSVAPSPRVPAAADAGANGHAAGARGAAALADGRCSRRTARSRPT